MRPGSGSFANAAARLKWFTSGQPQMYAIRPTISTYARVMTVPAGVPATSAADLGGGTCCACAEPEMLSSNASTKDASVIRFISHIPPIFSMSPGFQLLLMAASVGP